MLKQHTVLKYFCLLFLFLIVPALVPASAHAQHMNCETTAIWQPGHGWVEGSEITTCTPIYTTNDGSEFIELIRNSCGIGNPCPEAPPDNDDEMTEEQFCSLEQATEGERDSIANNIANEIMKKSDWKRREYGAIIIRNAQGQLRTTELFRGNSNGSAVEFEFSMRAGEIIVGAIHNHSTNNYNNADGPSDADWDGAREWVENGLAIANSYSEYILSPTGSLAEFDYNGDFGRHSSRPSHRKDAQSEC